MMNAITATRSIVNSRNSSGAMIGERIIAQQPRIVVITSRRAYTTAGSSISPSNPTSISDSIIRSKTVLNRGDNLNMMYRVQTLPHRAMLSSSSTGNKNMDSENPFMRRSSNVHEDDLPPITLDNTIRMKNAGLAAVLVAFCFGIAYYSMNAVGQAGTTTSTNEDDPLAVLKAEAAVAQEKYDKEQQETVNTADMLQKFQMGEYDPDHVSDEELDNLDEPNKKKRPWYKFW